MEPQRLHGNGRRIALATVLKEVHAHIPSQDIDTRQVGAYEIRKCHLDGDEVNRLIVYVRASGCQWVLQDGHAGCFMCGHLAGTTQGRAISPQDFARQLQGVLDRPDLPACSMIGLYNAGSFFNDAEIPASAREEMYALVAARDCFERVIFESRPEFITEAELARLRRLLPGRRIEIGVGLESRDEYVRQVCLNKGFSLDEFLAALDRVKRTDAKFLAYVLLKPPFLSEARAVADAVEAIRWAFSQGVDVISLEPVSVQKYTLVHLLHGLNRFRPPWIWSVMAVVRQVHDLGLVRIGGFEFFPPPALCVHNCDACNERCVEAIERYNATNDISVIDEAFAAGCAVCKGEWEQALQDDSTPDDNIDAFLAEVKQVDIGQRLRDDL